MKKETQQIIKRVETIKLLIDYLKANYKKIIFMSDMAKEVILHEALELYDFTPNEIEMGWIIHTLKK